MLILQNEALLTAERRRREEEDDEKGGMQEALFDMPPKGWRGCRTKSRVESPI